MRNWNRRALALTTLAATGAALWWAETATAAPAPKVQSVVVGGDAADPALILFGRSLTSLKKAREIDLVQIDPDNSNAVIKTFTLTNASVNAITANCVVLGLPGDVVQGTYELAYEHGDNTTTLASGFTIARSTPGGGLSLSGGTFSVDFAGSGSAKTAARSDHDHDGTYVRTAGDTMTGTLEMAVNGTAECIHAVGSTASQIAYLEATGTNGRALQATYSGVNGDVAIFDYAGTTGGNSLTLQHNGTAGAFMTCDRTDAARVARIDITGRGYFNGGTQTGGADFAESVAVDRPRTEFEAGDVMVIDPSGVRRFAKSSAPRSTAVAGVYSTKPGVLAHPYDVAEEKALAEREKDEIPLAITGIVPCKVCDEGGAIRAGDLLVTSSVPGRAMKAPASVGIGTVVGKALGALTSGKGVIEILVAAR